MYQSDAVDTPIARVMDWTQGPNFDLPGPAGLFGSVVGTSLVARIVYRLYFHPLASYPGPLLAKITGAYQIFLLMAGRATFARYEWHKRYGPVVRVGPNELCFADQHSIRDLYGQSIKPCLKYSPFYSGISLGIADSVFTVVDRGQHARIRRLLANQFSLAGIKQCTAEVSHKIQTYCDAIRRLGDSGRRPVDLHDLTRHLYLDIISQLGFAKSFDLLLSGRSQAAQDIETYFSIAPLYGLFPLARSFPFGIFRAAREARPRVVNFVQTCIDDFRSQSNWTDSSKRGGLLKQMIEARDTEESEKSNTITHLSDPELIENAILFLNAGSETTSTTLLYLLWEVGTRPDVFEPLVKEIRTAFPDTSVFPDLDTALDLVRHLRCSLT